MSISLCRSRPSKALRQGIALVGAGVALNFQCIQLEIVDCFPLHATSGTLISPI
ncbi:hypothetical protein BD769DRAFT_807701 [Suillus cothurnatus]|nr:hypothetical protein BD769DRAFT_807701 [Suillus cothurnatus]